MKKDKLIRLPRKFIDDHVERDLPTPEFIRSTKTSVYIRADDPNLPELINDAEHYADPQMRGRGGWDESVIPLCKAAERMLAAYHDQTGDDWTLADDFGV